MKQFVILTRLNIGYSHSAIHVRFKSIPCFLPSSRKHLHCYRVNLPTCRLSGCKPHGRYPGDVRALPAEYRPVHCRLETRTDRKNIAIRLMVTQTTRTCPDGQTM
ncbi:hypothetical protein Bbelb_353450 [Branchiostoma belcheri]|nr:hypothetical protein Bbelb_353450 [Branchiostoma belcheri]